MVGVVGREGGSWVLTQSLGALASRYHRDIPPTTHKHPQLQEQLPPPPPPSTTQILTQYPPRCVNSLRAKTVTLRVKINH